MSDKPSHREITGQGELAGIENYEPLDYSKQLTFAGALHYPVNWGVRPVFLDTEARYMMALMTPERIATTLINVKAQARSSVSYQNGETGSHVRVALTPTEYSFMARNIPALGEASVNRTLASRQQRLDFAPDKEAAGRSGVYTAQGYIDKMDTYIKQTLEPDKAQLVRFEEYVRNPHLRRLKGSTFKQEMTWIHQHIFEDILVAMSRQRDWTPEQDKLARQSLDARLFLDKEDNNYLKNWTEMLEFSKLYTGHKWALFKTKKYELENYVRNNSNLDNK